MKKSVQMITTFFVLSGMLPIHINAQNSKVPWTILPSHEIGALEFRTQNATWDGRGVVLAVLDTGVDQNIAGLALTSTGQTKVIDARDFTEEGEWPVCSAEYEDGEWKHPDGLILKGAADLLVPPRVDQPKYPVYIGVIDETDFQGNNRVADFTDDGDRDDRFGMMVYWADRQEVEKKLGVGRGLTFLKGLNEKAEEEVERLRSSSGVWLVVADTDGDGRLEDEKILRDYLVNWDTFSPFAPQNPEGRHMMTWSVNVQSPKDFSDSTPSVVFHFDSGAHGSHCAGIASGYEVNGQEGLDGVAPGAWVMSLKIGDNSLSGGATRTESMKRAAEYAAEFGRRFDLPVVVNMSYGIASVEEEEDAIGEAIDEILFEHPNFYFCTSAGNEGPGLSTIGIPATSQHVISSGAFLSVEAGRDLYHGKINRNTLFSFSSRGGETPKPDVVAPGTAMSTVPTYVDGSARFHGTSMASPQTAGAVACLVSAALDQKLDVHWGMIKRALISGGVPQDGLLLVEQGGGLVNIPKSWDVLQKIARSKTAHEILDYRIRTACPFQTDGEAPAAYWRTMGGTPRSVSFFVSPVFHPDLDADQRDGFFRSFRLASDVSWIKPIAQRRYIKGDMEMEIRVQYDEEILKRSGLSCGRVIGSLEGGDLKGLAAREFALWNTLINAERFDSRNGYQLSFGGKGLDPSTVDRHFVYIPAGTSALHVLLDASRTADATEGIGATVEIFNPEGAYLGGTGYTQPGTEPVRDFHLTVPKLRSGIWEVDVIARRNNTAPTPYQLKLRVDGYSCDPETITELCQPGVAEPAVTHISVTRELSGVFRGYAKAVLLGFRVAETQEIKGSDTFSKAFSLDSLTPSVDITLTMEEDIGNLFTDIAVLVVDENGDVVRSGGFAGLVFHSVVTLPSGIEKGDYTLKVIGAFANQSDMESWSFHLDQRFQFAEKIMAEVTLNEDEEFNIYCGLSSSIRCSFPDTGRRPPMNMHTYGAVRFYDRNGATEMTQDGNAPLVLEVPIRLEP